MKGKNSENIETNKILIGKVGIGIARHYVPPHKLINSKRKDLKKLYYNGGFGCFEGTIVKLEGSDCLLNPVFFKRYHDEKAYKYKENFVWIKHFKEKTEEKFKIGDCIKFDGAVDPYENDDGTFEIEIAAINNIRLCK